MRLYHGSNQIIRQPDLSKGRKFLDFGCGFYLSDKKSQAETRAKSAVVFFEDGLPTVNIFDWNDEIVVDLNVLHFPTANIEWLDFVLANRQGNVYALNNQYDIVIGPTANDKTILVVDQFIAGCSIILKIRKSLSLNCFNLKNWRHNICLLQIKV